MTANGTQSDLPEYYEAGGERIRDRLLDALRCDLLGPEEEDETLQQSPATRYLVGMLAPQGTTLSPDENDSTQDVAEGEEPSEGGPAATQSLVPSSIGLSFVVANDTDSVEVHASWGEYRRVERTEESAVDPEQAADIDPDADPNRTAKKTKRKEQNWIRTPSAFTHVIPLAAATGEKKFGPEARLTWLVEALHDVYIVSVFLSNARPAPKDRRPPDETWMYQPAIRVTGAGAPFLARRLPRTEPDPEPDVATADLLYRNRREFAVGHGVAAEWTIDSVDGHRASEVRSIIVPAESVAHVRGPEKLPELSMDAIGEAADGQAIAQIIEPMLTAYDAWIEGNERRVPNVPAPDDAVAHDHIALEKQSLRRMRRGVETIREDPLAYEAFCFANRAMALQRRATVKVLAQRRNEPVPTDVEIPAAWRPFQLGFILQALSSLANPADDDRRTADLLWYPTGGGKTEAYLGLTAFIFALRRLWGQRDGYDFAAGTAVLMRYTLRLLTLQQFQRALTLICACEVLRREDEARWGREPFSIGLWVGQSVTPNRYDDAKEAIDKLKKSQRVYEKSPYQIRFCPWCGKDLDPENYDCDDELQRTLIKCWNADCAFGARNAEMGLPALVVDEEIYHHPPSLLLATVDKFAQMAWTGRIRSLFGRVDRYCARHGFLAPGDKHAQTHRETQGLPAAVVRLVETPHAPPDLIIQDELHLISGPLGSLVGIYESVIDGLCTRQSDRGPVPPKVVASTATIRRAARQLQALFDRDTEIFPALGLETDDSFFAVEDRDQPGRLYVGVFGPGKSLKTTLVRTYAVLLSRAQFEFDRRRGEIDTERANGSIDEETAERRFAEADAYMTLVGYFNSLRELGGARRLLDDDVPGRLRVLHKRGFGPRRTLYEKDRELTSRRPSYEIADNLKALDRTFRTRESGQYPIDVLLASNMISVGVDIDRLGMMVVSAQPKTTAEYIQATSRVGRVHPGLIVEVYNWVRPRDISHYERFAHYHDTFYRHVEATSVTPFSERARDRALPGVLAAYVRQSVSGMASPEAAANAYDNDRPEIAAIIEALADRAGRVTGKEEVRTQTQAQLTGLSDEWNRWARSGELDLVYAARGLGGKKKKTGEPDKRTVLLRTMEAPAASGRWPTANSLREVEEEIDVILLPEGE